MGSLTAFIQISLDGYFTDVHGDMGWMYSMPRDAEWQEFVEGNARGGGVLLFGRVTYRMMEGYWPTPLAAGQNPVVAERMNNLEKVVFSRTMNEATWSNTTLVKDDMIGAVRAMKEAGKEMATLGSGSIVTQLAQAGLIDEYQIVIYPIALGDGRSLFKGMEKDLRLSLTSSRTFTNGNVVLRYAPQRAQAGAAAPQGT
jgi:dihydrofolate reductase